MKKLRILALLLVCAMALPLISCVEENKKPVEIDETTGEDTTAEETTAEETVAPEIKNYDEVRTFKITEKLHLIKTFGRTSVTTQGLACDHTATGPSRRIVSFICLSSAVIIQNLEIFELQFSLIL